jgi:hypothetical protein
LQDISSDLWLVTVQSVFAGGLPIDALLVDVGVAGSACDVFESKRRPAAAAARGVFEQRG